ncbi:integral membrane protein [Macrophomina phaseolina MS6]|uniref:Integral membrane protein n=1 Tax=Macrophomina phaseolina (strain MS6) TaxID=1126212 RepID=K2R9F5_MACPH|nr:integral membrane protein [Macrophomina phaseolina MS6]
MRIFLGLLVTATLTLQLATAVQPLTSLDLPECAVFLAPLTAGAILLAQNGLGKDIWTLPFHSVDSTLYIFYVQEHLYIICTVLIKISFLLFYFRIFPDATFRKVVGATMIFAICFGIGALFGFAFQCTPIDRAWHGWDDEHPGFCVDINALVLIAASLNICADFWIIVLPIPGIFRLQSSVRMKLQISAMFCTGFFITAVSVYRAVMLTHFATTDNPTWDWCDGGYWSIIEVDVGIVCTNMPAIRSLLGRIIPKVFGSTAAKDTATEHSRPVARSSQTPRGIRSFKGSRTEADSFVQLIEMDSRSLKNHVGNKSSES